MKTRKLIALAVAVATVAIAQAMPAKKQVTVTQPDGTTITLRGYGDEWHHYFTTTDGYTVMQSSDGWYCYANQALDGNLVASSVRVSDPLRRGAAERQAISGLRTNMVNERAVMAGGVRRGEAGRHRSEALETRRAQALAAPATRAATGSTRTIVLLAAYKNVAFSTANINQAINNLLNQDNYGGTGSAKNYYEANSNGLFTVDFDVYGPYTLPQNRAYYGANDADENDIRPQQMIIDVCNLANAAGVRFSNYAVNGEVPNLIVIYAGQGEADGGPEESIWPHEWTLPSAKTYDGVRVYTYACSSELQGSGALTGIGVICHEYGHALGLPDFYDTNYDDNGSAFGLDVTSLMDYGGYCYQGAVPPSFNIVERWMIGWATPTEITEAGDYILKPVYSNQDGYYIKTLTTKDWYFLENRNGNLFVWDKVLKSGDPSTGTSGSGNGMLIYHYDASTNKIGNIYPYGNVTAAKSWEYNVINCVAAHECMKLMMAQTIKRSSNGTMSGLGKVFYPGTGGITSFVANGWTSGFSGVSLSGIAISGDNVMFKVNIDSSVSDPTIRDVVVKPNQFDITVIWDGAIAGSWKVEYRQAGTSTYKSIITDHKIANLPGLTPGTNYEIVITDQATSNFGSTTAKTGTVQVARLQSLNEIKATYTTDEAVILSAVNIQGTVSLIEWTVDGQITGTTCLFMTSGKHTIEAKIITADGSVEYLKRVITVTNA